MKITIRRLRTFNKWIVEDENGEMVAKIYSKKFVDYLDEVVPKLQKACLDALNVMVLGLEVSQASEKFSKTFEKVAGSLKKVLGLVEVIQVNEDNETTHPN